MARAPVRKRREKKNITSGIAHAFKHCKRIVALKDGEVAYDGPTGDISPQQIAALYGVEGLDLVKDAKAADEDMPVADTEVELKPAAVA